jgi:hypothetical protein
MRESFAAVLLLIDWTGSAAVPTRSAVGNRRFVVVDGMLGGVSVGE